MRGGALLGRSRVLGWALVLAVLVLWQVAGTLDPMPALPVPTRVAAAWWGYVLEGEMVAQTLSTLRTLFAGYAAASVLGIVTGFLMGRVRVLWGLLEPLVELVRLTPASALIPLFILFFGIGDQMKLAVLLCSATFPVLLNTYAGARAIPRALLQTARTFELSWARTQWEVALPAALPYIAVGLRQALGTSLVLAVVTGMLAGNSGIGYFILRAQQTLNPLGLLSGVITVAALGYLLNAGFLALERRATPWNRSAAAHA